MTRLLSTALVAAGLAVTAAAHAQGSGSPTLDAIRARGQLVCGTGGQTAGFSLVDSKGNMTGLDADGCRELAAAVLGAANKVKFVPLTSVNRFTALQSGEVDVLIRETTWTLSREANLGALFAGINYYDGTGFLVKTASGVTSAKGLDGATVCVQLGSSTELADADYFRKTGMKLVPVESDDVNQLRESFLSGRCDAFSNDSSALASFRSNQGAKAAELTLLPELISQEPLGPMVRKGDDKWFDVVRWTFFASLLAEQYGVTSQNIDQMAGSGNPDIRRLLGIEGDLGKALGLDNKFAYSMVKQVGNFAEIWQRDITPLGVPRGLNALWDRGGLMYPPPMR